MVTVSHLRRTFGDRVAVDDVSFELAPGAVFGLLGPNGRGKPDPGPGDRSDRTSCSCD